LAEPFCSPVDGLAEPFCSPVDGLANNLQDFSRI
jgi:hypothetical protein